MTTTYETPDSSKFSLFFLFRRKAWWRYFWRQVGRHYGTTQNVLKLWARVVVVVVVVEELNGLKRGRKEARNTCFNSAIAMRYSSCRLTWSSSLTSFRSCSNHFDLSDLI